MIDPKTPRMAFANLHGVPFNEGENVTVRAGRKWFNTLWAGGVKGHDLVLLDGTGAIVGEGRVRKLAFKRFVDIDTEELGLNHDPACRLFQRLLARMEVLYPGFKIDDYVTIVTFEVK